MNTLELFGSTPSPRFPRPSGLTADTADDRHMAGPPLSFTEPRQRDDKPQPRLDPERRRRPVLWPFTV